jgi:hypothetical protein
VWDSESEVTKEGTLLESAMRVEDASDSEPSGRKRKGKEIIFIQQRIQGVGMCHKTIVLNLQACLLRLNQL